MSLIGISGVSKRVSFRAAFGGTMNNSSELLLDYLWLVIVLRKETRQSIQKIEGMLRSI